MAQPSLNDDMDVTVDYSVTIDKFSNSVCPYELRGDHSYTTGPGCFPAIYKILTACSKMRILHLTVRQGNFEFSPGDRQEADTRGWRWYRNYLSDVTGIYSVHQIGRIEEVDPESIRTNLDLWRGAMD